jgi:hypothetical protein
MMMVMKSRSVHFKKIGLRDYLSYNVMCIPLGSTNNNGFR